MKKLILITAFCGCTGWLSAQNTFPTNGNAGVGTTNPTAAFDVALPTITSVQSGIRITKPFTFNTSSSINSLFHVRSASNTLGQYQSLFTIKNDGNVGIGVPENSPFLTNTKLVVTDNDVSKVDLNVRGFALINGANASLLFGATGGETYGQWGIEYNEFVGIRGLNFWKPSGSNNFGNYYLFLADNGKVSIGLDPNNPNTYSGDYKLYVAKGIMTEKVKVALQNSSDWADYVFKSDYNLMPLDNLQDYIKQNGHLPNVPSADEVVENGIDMAKMDARLLEKIEELTLYILQQEQRIKSLESQLKNN